MFGGERPHSRLWPVSLVGQLKIAQVSTTECNLCRWDVCSSAVAAAGKRVFHVNLLTLDASQKCQLLQTSLRTAFRISQSTGR